ncbi:hypothetical protein Tco_1520505 [Tanacetum coccineum]
MVLYQSLPQNSQIVLANQLDNFKKTTEGSMQVMRNHITNLKAEIRSEVQATSYVGSDYVFYEDFNLVDMIFPMNIQGKIFDPGITFHGKSFEKDAFKDKSSKELASSKALLTLDVFDPLHPPLMDFHVTKAFSGFTFSLLKIFSKKFFEPGIKNATESDKYRKTAGVEIGRNRKNENCNTLGSSADIDKSHEVPHSFHNKDIVVEEFVNHVGNNQNFDCSTVPAQK